MVDLKLTLFICLLLLIGFAIGTLLMYFSIIIPRESSTVPLEQYNLCHNYTTVNQLVACYKGCQFLTQPDYNLTVEPFEIRTVQYENCSKKCKNEYNLIPLRPKGTEYP